MKSQLTKAPDGTITLTIPLPKAEIQKAREEVVEHAISELELPGFRKGKAPRNVAEEKLDEAKIQEEVLRNLLPKAYSNAILEHSLKPIMSPKIRIEKLPGKDEDGKFEAIVCEQPLVELNNYKDGVKAVTAKSKIVLPGKEKQNVSFDEIMKAVLDNTTATIPSVLVESEAERLLSQLLDEVKTLGLTLDQYLASTHKTVEDIKKEYEARARNDIIIEFVLQKIADQESISVSSQEIEEAITKAPTPQEKENLEKNRYVLTAILRQQKTFDFLKNL